MCATATSPTTTATSTLSPTRRQIPRVPTTKLKATSSSSTSMYDKSKKSWSQRLKLSANDTKTTSNSAAAAAAVDAQQHVSNMQAMQQLQQALQMQHQMQPHRGYALPPPAAPPPGYEFLPSALSRSMKYAEPWIYGTVRGIPARPSYHHQLVAAGYGHHQLQLHHHQLHPHAAAIFATETEASANATTTALAVVICSCAEYLTGTKRDVKKASVCKKCKGSRLPLATIATGGGTVRLPTAAGNVRLRGSNGGPVAATMRVVSTSKKSRPTILDTQKDPYDLMRRTRLLSPEPSVTTTTNSNADAKETKSRPIQRGRSRTRAAAPPLPSSTTKQSQSQSQQSKSKPQQSKPQPQSCDPADCWLVEDNESLLQSSGLVSASRRSILRCNVNPYDLISIENGRESGRSGSGATHTKSSTTNNTSITSTTNIKSPLKSKGKSKRRHDDFDVADAQLNDDCDSTSTTTTTTTTSSSSPVNVPDKASKFYSSNVQAIAGQRISLGDGDSDNYERIIVAVEALTSTSASTSPSPTASVSHGPRRPPRNKKPDESPLVPIATAATCPPPATADDVAKEMMPELPPNDYDDDENENDNDDNDDYDNDEDNVDDAIVPNITVLTVMPTSPGIKSILKRPSTLDLGTTTAMPTTTTTSTVSPSSVCVEESTMLLTPSSKSQFYIPLPSSPTPTTISSPASTSSSTPLAVATTTMPSVLVTATRKKVQFMVEDKIIATAATPTTTTTTATMATTDDSGDNATCVSDDSSATTTTTPTMIKTTNYEYYNRKRHAAAQQEQKQQQQQQQNQQQQQRLSHQIASDVDDEHNFTASGAAAAAAEVAATTAHIKPDSLHYEDVEEKPQPPATAAPPPTLLLPQIFDNSSGQQKTETNEATEIVQATSNSKLLLSAAMPTTSLSAAAATHAGSTQQTTAAVAAQGMSGTTGITTAAKTTTTPPHVMANAVVNGFTTLSTTMTTTTTTAPSEPISKGCEKAAQKATAANRDYDDDTKTNNNNEEDENGNDDYDDNDDDDDNHNAKEDGGKAIGGQVVYPPQDCVKPEATKGVTATPTTTAVAMAKKPTQKTQSRNPIRRAHSERHLSSANNTKANGATTNVVASLSACSTPSPPLSPLTKAAHHHHNHYRAPHHHHHSEQAEGAVDAIAPHRVNLNFKDTMALRVKNNRNDSRDLFQRRPKEPPPPPPPQGKQTTTSINGLAHEINTPSTHYQNPTETQRQQQPHQRTVVRVAPFNNNNINNDNNSGVNKRGQQAQVHRLTISHTDDEVELRHSNNSSTPETADDGAQKKTSILISGDDCYSTMNLSLDTSQPLYQSSVVVKSDAPPSPMRLTSSANTVTINVSSPPARTSAEELIYHHNKINTLRSQQAMAAIIPIKANEINLQRSASCNSSNSSSSLTSTTSTGSSNSSSTSTSTSGVGMSKRGRTLIRLDYEKEKQQPATVAPTMTTINATAATPSPEVTTPEAITTTPTTPNTLVAHETELLKILRNPVEAVKRNLVPHVCGRVAATTTSSGGDSPRDKKMKQQQQSNKATPSASVGIAEGSFISKLLQDPMLSQLADGLETDTVAELIEQSLRRLQQTRKGIDMSGTKDHDDMNRLIRISLQRIRAERQPTATTPAVTTGNTVTTAVTTQLTTKDEDRLSNRGSISSANSFASAHNYELFDFEANESDCYQSCSSELTAPGTLDDDADETTRAKFYQLLVDATLAEIEHSAHSSEHHYESIRHTGDPIYEEITDMPPPLPLSAPPLNDTELEKKAARSIFEGASKYDILSYLVDAKERGVAREETFDYSVNSSNNPKIIEEEAADTLSDLDKRRQLSTDDQSQNSQSANSNSLSPPPHTFICGSDIERQDSGVGSETSKMSRSKYQPTSPLHLCEDCDGAVETQLSETGLVFAPLVCRKCGKKRVERKEIITEIVETEEKYGRDLQIILEEFCQPMLVAGLLTQEQLSAIFLNTEDLLENNQTLAERMRDALDIALEQGDDDLLTVNIGRILLDFTQMLHAFESYCVRQAGASLLLANLEKEKELLRIFLKVSQMENAVLRRMNLNSFLMVPVQRVTKYPLLLARLYKVTPAHLDGRELLKQAQEKIELHLNHINQEAKDVPTKLWRRISSSSPNRRASCEIDMINIKLRKMAIDILEWNHDEVRFAMEGKLLYTQPTDSNWKKARTIKLTPLNALLVTNGKPSANYKAEKAMSDKLNFPKHTGIREASLLLVKEKCGRYTLIREPLYLDRCVVCSEADWDDYFEVQEISSKDTFIFKAEDGVRTKQWYTQLQYHAQGMGAWRKRRNALANIMINGMLARS